MTVDVNQKLYLGLRCRVAAAPPFPRARKMPRLSHSAFPRPVRHADLVVTCHLCRAGVPSLHATYLALRFQPLPFLAVCGRCCSATDCSATDGCAG